MRVLIGFEESAAVRDEFRALGHDAWSCDFKATRGDPRWHIQGDIFEMLAKDPDWDLGIFHPTCTYLANSGSKHLYRGMKKEGGINPGRWAAMVAGAGTFRALLTLPFPFAIENPVMHGHGKLAIGGIQQSQTIQPWWFGEPYFKATCLWLHRVPRLRETNRLTPPKPGTDEHKRWSAVHREAPGPERQQNRSATYRGIAQAMADQWGGDLLARMAA